MHCKHCGNQIENDSKFCSFCGGKIDPVGQTFHQTQQPLTQVQTEPVLTPVNEKITVDKTANAFLVIALVVFGFKLFWVFINLMDYDVYSQFLPVLIPLSIISSVIVLFLCFFFSKKKEHKTLFLILAVCQLAWDIYQQYLKS
jgi:hypothetical protein